MFEDTSDINAITIFKSTDSDDPFQEMRSGHDRRMNDYGILPLHQNSGETSDTLITDILIAGAVCRGRELSGPDITITGDGIIAAQKFGFKVAHDFALTAMNLCNSDDGDFLRHTRKAQMIIIANIFDVPMRDAFLYGHYGHQSSLHHDNNTWHDAANRAGANFIVAYATNKEVGVERFMPTPPNPSLFRCVENKGRPAIDYLYPRSALIRSHLLPHLNV